MIRYAHHQLKVPSLESLVFKLSALSSQLLAAATKGAA